MNEDKIRDGLRRAGGSLPHHEGSVETTIRAGRRRKRRTALVIAGAALVIAVGGVAGVLALTGGGDSASLDMVTPPTSSVPDTAVAPTTRAPAIATTTVPELSDDQMLPPPPILLADGDSVTRWTPAGTEVLVEGDGALTAAFDDLRDGLVVQTTDDRGVRIVRWYPFDAEPVTLREASVHDVVEIDGEPTALISRVDGDRVVLDELTLSIASARTVGTFDAVTDVGWDGDGYLVVTEPELGCDALVTIDRFGEEQPDASVPSATECDAVQAVGPVTVGPDRLTMLLYTENRVVRDLVLADPSGEAGTGASAIVPGTDRVTDVDGWGDWLVVARSRDETTLLFTPEGTTIELPPAIGASFGPTELEM